MVDITLRKQTEEKLKNYSEELEKQVKTVHLFLKRPEELQRTKKELYHALEKERELNELKSRFVSMASHEFRTPLTTIMSSLALVKKYGEQNSKDDQVRHIGEIRAAVHNMTDILDDLLSVSKLEEGKLRSMPETINLKTFINQVTSEMQALASPGQQLVTRYTGKEIAILDKKFLKNILLNLISNSIKFSPPFAQINIRTKVTESAVKISVSDHGIRLAVPADPEEGS